MISSVITSSQSLRSIQLGGNPFLNSADGLNHVIGALQSRPDLLSDCCLAGSNAKIKQALDASEKKFQNLPIRMRYAAMQQIHLQWFQCAFVSL